MKKKEACEGANYVIYSPEDCDSITVEALPPLLDTQRAQTKYPVDILFVLDTSPTMQFYYRDVFQHRFKDFISILDQGLDWSLLYTNTEYRKKTWWSSPGNNGKALKLESSIDVLDSSTLTQSTPDYKNVFLYSFTFNPERHSFEEYGDAGCDYPPYCQSGDSQPFTALKTSFQVNKHLTRAEADLAVVIVTNSDNNPINENEEDSDKSTDESIVTADQVVQEFSKVYTNKRFFVFNIIIQPDDPACLELNQDQQALFSSGDVHEGKNLADLVKKTSGGGNFSICSEDYATVARSIIYLTKSRLQ